MQNVDAILENFRFAPERCRSASFVFCNLYGGKHRAVHALKGDEVAAGIDDRYVHLPIPLLRFRQRRANNRLCSVQRYRRTIRNIGGHFSGTKSRGFSSVCFITNKFCIRSVCTIHRTMLLGRGAQSRTATLGLSRLSSRRAAFLISAIRANASVSACDAERDAPKALRSKLPSSCCQRRGCEMSFASSWIAANAASTSPSSSRTDARSMRTNALPVVLARDWGPPRTVTACFIRRSANTSI